MILNVDNFIFDLTQGLDISIGLHSGFGQVNAFHAPPFRISPVKEGDFIGSTKLGGVVNFMNFQCNPHGNGTHTECVGHIAKEDYFVNDCIQEHLYLAELISVYPMLLENGDKVIDVNHIKSMISSTKCSGLILRTLSNDIDKKERNYSGTNPTYITPEAMNFIVQKGIIHLLVDIPSVDRESDEGKLSSHKIFWNYPENPQTHKSITELIYVPNEIKDGIYLVQNSIMNIRLDAVPSRPILYSPIK